MHILRIDKFESIISVKTKNCNEVELKLVRVKKAKELGN